MAFWRKKPVIAKIEDTYATDATPTGAANALEIENLSITPMEGTEVRRTLDRAYLGGQTTDVVNKHVVATFDVAIAGSGAAGTAPAWGPLLRACGFAETITEDVSVAYAPISGGFESLSMYTNVDGTLHKMLGARGTVSMRLRASDYPRFSFRFLGLFQPVTAAALPAQVLDAWKAPLVVSHANTPTFTLDGYAAVLEELSLDIANDVQGRFLVGQEQIAIVDRNGSGSARIEAPALGTKDFFALAAQSPAAAVALQCVHGTTAGNIVTIDAPAVQIGRPSYQNVQGFVHLQIPLMLQPDEGNDELEITCT